VLGGLWQPRGGTARHDAVAWGYARAAAALGVDIIQQCEVIGVDRDANGVTGVRTTKGAIACGKLCIVVAGSSGVLADIAGFRLPVESVALQALVSEPIKPALDCVVMANTVHGYVSQSDKGEMVIGGGADGFNNYTQRGSFQHIEETVRALIETFPMLSRLKMLRQWGGIVDMTGDRSPIIGTTPVPGIFINCGWGTGGFKAIPGSGWATAEMLSKGTPGDLAAPFSLDRFREGRMIDEKRRRGGGALMFGAGTFAPERVAAAEVDPELVMMVIEDIADRPAPDTRDGIELFATCAAAYFDFTGIEAEPGEDALEEEDLVVIVALASRVTALSGLAVAGHLDHKKSPATEEGMMAVAVAASRATLLHRDGQPSFQLLEFLTLLQRAEQEGGPW
jgi:hypothetical protein